jgi:hypothetical protein
LCHGHRRRRGRPRLRPLVAASERERKREQHTDRCPAASCKTAKRTAIKPGLRSQTFRSVSRTHFRLPNDLECCNRIGQADTAAPARTAAASGNKATSLIPPPRGATTSITSLLCISSLPASQSGIVFRVPVSALKVCTTMLWRVTLQSRQGKSPLAIESIDDCYLPLAAQRDTRRQVFKPVLEVASYTGFFVVALKAYDGSIRSPAELQKVS